MGKDANELAMRDAALASLMGVDGMTDFGTDEVLFAGDDDFGTFGADYDFSADFGADAPAALALPVTHPNHPLHTTNPAAAAIIQKHLHRAAATNSRKKLIDPNGDSDEKIERYNFSINGTITALGTSQTFISGQLQGSPDVDFRPERITANVPAPGFLLVSSARVANVNFTVGGSLDAWTWNANGVGQALSVPKLTPANKATIEAYYTGQVPSPLSGTGSYALCFTFAGWATITA
jgi:hypothetical protein